MAVRGRALPKEMGEMDMKLPGTCFLLGFAVITAASCGDTDDSKEVQELRSSRNSVIGGTESVLGSRPWQVQIQVPGVPHQCGGSLINAEWVLTAKHCVSDFAPSDITAVLGENDRGINEGTEQYRNIQAVISHPTRDVALLQLSGAVTINAHVSPVILARTGDIAGVPAVVSGWGNTYPGSGASDLLMEAELPIQPNSACNSAPKLSRDLYPYELCAGYLNGVRGGCHGDSGGPLVSYLDGQWKQVGIVNWGEGYRCSTYTVFARVTSNIDWIRTYVALPEPFHPWTTPVRELILH